MAGQPRVVITGLGVVAPNGIGRDAYWDGLTSGRSGVDRITLFDASELPCQIAGEVKGFDPASYMSVRDAKRVPRVSQFAIAAAKMAVDDVGVQITPENSGQIGVCFGAGFSKPEVFETDHQPYLNRGVRGIHPTTLFELSSHAVSSHVAMALGANGICGTLSMGCTVGLDVVQWSYQQLYFRRAAMMVVGSAEALLTPFIFSVTCALGVLSQRNHQPQQASRPFDQDRDGLVLGEGSGAFVLEEFEHARARGATIYGEILGIGEGRTGQSEVDCDDSGSDMASVMETALYQAKRQSADIDYVCAHGNGHRKYDIAETKALKQVLGRHAYSIPVSSIKSMIGQPFSAGGSLQIVASCLALQHHIVPPTINYEAPDPECDLDYVPQRARRSRIRNVLIHAHGIAGTDAVVILGKANA